MGRTLRNLFLFIALSILLLTSTASCSLFAQGVPRSTKPANPDLLLVGANGSIYSLSVSGSRLTRLFAQVKKRGILSERIDSGGGAVFSPDRKTIAYVLGVREISYSPRYSPIPMGAGQRTEIWLMDASGNDRRKLTTVYNPMMADRDVNSLQWSSDGKLLYCTQSQTFFSVDMNGKKTESTGYLPSWEWNASLNDLRMAISPDGRRVAFLLDKGIAVAKLDKMLVSDPKTIFSETSADIHVGGSFGGGLAWQSDEDLLFIEEHNNVTYTKEGSTTTQHDSLVGCSIMRINVETRAVSRVYSPPPGNEVGYICISPNRKSGSILLDKEQRPGVKPDAKPWLFDIQTGSGGEVPLPCQRQPNLSAFRRTKMSTF